MKSAAKDNFQVLNTSTRAHRQWEPTVFPWAMDERDLSSILKGIKSVLVVFKKITVKLR